MDGIGLLLLTAACPAGKRAIAAAAANASYLAQYVEQTQKSLPYFPLGSKQTFCKTWQRSF
jgi:hypothetical protein